MSSVRPRDAMLPHRTARGSGGDVRMTHVHLPRPRATAVALLVTAAAACSSSLGTPPRSEDPSFSPTSTASAARGSGSPSPSPPALSTYNGEPIRIELDLDEPVAEPKQVASVPYGSAVNELGISNCYHCEVVQPKTMAVDRRGSIWIADNDKARLVHLSSRGAYLDDARFPGAREVRDLETVGKGVVALLRDGTLVRLDSRGRVLGRSVIRYQGEPLYLYRLFESGGRLFAHSFGTNAGRGPEGVVEICADGSVEWSPGVPLTDSWVRVDLHGHARQRWYALALTRANQTERRRFEIRSFGRPFPKGLLVDVELKDVVAGRAVVGLAPLTRPWYDPVSLGYWVTFLSPRGELVRSYRVSAPGTPRGALVIGADGRIYQMINGEDRVVVVRLLGGTP